MNAWLWRPTSEPGRIAADEDDVHFSVLSLSADRDLPRPPENLDVAADRFAAGPRLPSQRQSEKERGLRTVEVNASFWLFLCMLVILCYRVL
jgi:hypothetical protein